MEKTGSKIICGAPTTLAVKGLMMMMMMTVSIGGRTITNLRFTDGIDGLAGEELANSVERLNKASTAYGMEISAEKTKLMTNNTNGINTDIKVNVQKLETVTSFKYLGSFITDEGSMPEIFSRIAQTTAA